MGTLSIWHWLIVLLVVVLVFGTKKLRNVGQDLGGAVKGFKDGMREAESSPASSSESSADGAGKPTQKISSGETLEGQATEVSKDKASS